MFSVRLEGYEEHSVVQSNVVDVKPFFCEPDCVGGIAVSSIFVALALIGYVLYLYMQHKLKAKSSNSRLPPS